MSGGEEEDCKGRGRGGGGGKRRKTLSLSVPSAKGGALGLEPFITEEEICRRKQEGGGTGCLINEQR